MTSPELKSTTGQTKPSTTDAHRTATQTARLHDLGKELCKDLPRGKAAEHQLGRTANPSGE